MTKLCGKLIQLTVENQVLKSYFPITLEILKFAFWNYYMEVIKVHDKEFVPYLKNEELQEIVKATALKIYEDYKDETPIFIGVLNGVIMFFQI